MLKERLQVLIDRDQRERLERRARERGTSVATLVREAIDLAFPSDSGPRREAATRILTAEPMEAPSVDELIAELGRAAVAPRVIVVDTTVLVYAVGAEHPLRAPCRRLIAAIGDGTLNATTTVEVIQEFTQVRARRRSRREAADRANDFAALFAPLLRPDEADLRRALELFVDHPDFGAFDAVLAAAVLNAPHLAGVLSADAAFGAVRRLTHFDPAAHDMIDRVTGR